MSYLDKWLYQKEKAKRDKFSGMANLIPGDVFHVVPASSDQLALAQRSHKNVLTTYEAAYDRVVTGRGDAIVLWDGTHSMSASVAASKAAVSVFGWEAWMGETVVKSSALLVAPAADEAMNITGVNMKIKGIQCRPVTTKSFADFTGAANGLTIKNCFIDLFTPVVNIATAGFIGSAAILGFLAEENFAWSDGAQGPAFNLIGANLYSHMRRNRYHVDAGSWAAAVGLDAIDGLICEDDLFTCGGTAMTAGYLGANTTVIGGVIFRNCHKGVLVTKLVDGFETTSHGELVNNYTATIGGGTGSTLVTAIT